MSQEQFADMMNEVDKPTPLINQEHTSIVGECQTESVVIKEELHAVCERLGGNIEPKEEYLSDELEPENQHSESDSEDDKPLTEFKIEVVEHEVSRNLPNQEDVITEEQKKNEQSDTNVIRTTENCTLNTVTKFNEILTGSKREVNHFSLGTSVRPKAKIQCEKSCKVIVSDIINRPRRRLRVEKKAFKCEICQRSFNLSRSLTNHIRTHTGEKPYKCDICQRRFNHESNLGRHIRIHAGVKPFKCDVCHRSFSEKTYLKIHIRTHTGEKPYKCKICQCSFKRTDNLTRHIRTHTGEKRYKCAVCLHCFSEKSKLTRHIRTHTGEKPYECDICQCRFKQKGALTNHIHKHTGKKLYQCDICLRGFNVKESLIRHIRTHTCV